MADWIEQLERLTQLHKAGVLTDEEFAAQKAKILAASDQPAAAPPPPPPPPVPAPVAAEPAPAWDHGGYDDQPRGGVPKWVFVAVPGALAVLAAAAWFGSSILGGSGPDPDLSATASAAASDAAVASAAPTEEAPLPVALDGSLAFASASNCKAGPTLEAIYKKLDSAGELGSGRGITVKLDAWDKALGIEAKNSTDADGIERRHAWLRFPEGTTWHGLRLSRVTSTTTIVPDSDGGYERTVNFMESPDKVVKTLARLGFGAPRGPDNYAELTDDGCGGSMQVLPVAGGSMLTCNWGC